MFEPVHSDIQRQPPLPGNNGRSVTISANIHPTLHMSTDVE